jgi:hypothetical protein
LFALLTHLSVFNIEYPQENTTRIKDYEEEKFTAAKELKLPSLHTFFKNYPTVDCGKSSYGATGPPPTIDSIGKSSIPAGCVGNKIGEIDDASR